MNHESHMPADQVLTEYTEQPGQDQQGVVKRPDSESFNGETFEDSPVEEEEKILKAASDSMKILQNENEPSVEEKKMSFVRYLNPEA